MRAARSHQTRALSPYGGILPSPEDATPPYWAGNTPTRELFQLCDMYGLREALIRANRGADATLAPQPAGDLSRNHPARYRRRAIPHSAPLEVDGSTRQ